MGGAGHMVIASEPSVSLNMRYHPRRWRVDHAINGLAREAGPIASTSPEADLAPTTDVWALARYGHLRGNREARQSGDDLDLRVIPGVAAFISGLEHGGQAAAIVDGIGRVIALNARGHRHIGPTLRLSGSELRAKSREMDERLQAFLRALVLPRARADSRPIDVTVLLEAGDPILLLRGSPIEDANLDILPGARAVVTFTDIGCRVAPPANLLSEIFGLTGTETMIAFAVAQGEDLQAIAARKNISVQTVRTHLKSIFGKTNTRRQLALAVLITKLSGV